MRRPRFHGHESDGRAVLRSASRSGPIGEEPVVPGCAVAVRDHSGRGLRGGNRRVQGVRGESSSRRSKETHPWMTTGDVSELTGLGSGNSPNPAWVA